MSTLSNTEIESAQELLKGSDRLGTGGKVFQTASGVAGGFALSGYLASAAGATTVLGSHILATLLPVAVASTPLGWVIGSGAALGAMAYGLASLISNGGENTERRRALDREMDALKKATVKPASRNVSQNGLGTLANQAVANGIITQGQSDQLFMLVSEGAITHEVAMMRIADLLRISGAMDESAPLTTERVVQSETSSLRESPELLIRSLLEKLYILRGAAAFLDNIMLAEKLEAVTRKLTLSEILANQAVIAVAGSQGAGKTTLVKMLYDLDGTWLQGNEGRGERSPLLIVEDSEVVTPSGHLLVQAEERDGDRRFYVQREIELTPEAFNQALQNAYPGQLLPKLKVPPRYFDGHGCGFLLLPGYEKGSKHNQVWQSLMRQSLVGADMCVIVTDETRLANRDQDLVLKDFRTELDGSLPIIVIAKTEGQDSERLAELRASAAQTFCIPTDLLTQRVICSGVDPERISSWRNALVATLQELPSVQERFRARQICWIHDVLTEEVADVLADIDMAAREVVVTSSVFSGPAQEILKAFDSGQSSVRRDYLRKLKKGLDVYSDESLGRALKALSDREEGAINTVRHSWRLVTTTTGEREYILPEYVISSWQTPWLLDKGKQSNFGHVHQRILASITMDRLGAPKDCKGYCPNGSAPRDELGYFSTAKSWMRPSTQQIKDLGLLFSSTDDGASVISPEMLDAVRLLPVIVMEYVRIGSLFPQLLGVRREDLIFSAFMEDDESDGSGLESIIGQQGMAILAVIGAALGINAAVDLGDEGGDFTPLSHSDSTDSLVSTLAGMGLSAGLLTSITVMLGAGLLAMNFAKSVQRSEGQARNAVRRMTAAIGDTHYAHFSTEFDHVMDRLRERLEMSLNKRYRQDEHIVRLDRLKKAHADVRMLSNDLRESLARNPIFPLG